MGDSTELREDWRRAHPTRLSPAHAHFDEIVRRHESAVDRGVSAYADPTSGFSVFTARFLAERGSCCDSGCRHCPYVV